jgi:hypothetical protein
MELTAEEIVDLGNGELEDEFLTTLSEPPSTTNPEYIDALEKEINRRRATGNWHPDA